MSDECPACKTPYDHRLIADALPSTVSLARLPGSTARRADALTVLECPECDVLAEYALSVQADENGETRILTTVSRLDEDHDHDATDDDGGVDR